MQISNFERKCRREDKFSIILNKILNYNAREINKLQFSLQKNEKYLPHPSREVNITFDQ